MSISNATLFFKSLKLNSEEKKLPKELFMK